MEANRSITLGQAPDADVHVNDPYVSAQHCRITESGGRFYIEDLGSTNGTRMTLKNGVTLHVTVRVRIPAGANIRIGRTTLRGRWTDA